MDEQSPLLETILNSLSKHSFENPVYRPPINPSTGRPWTAEERGPMVSTPKPAGVNPQTGKSYPSMGYTTGDKAGSYFETLEYVPNRDDVGAMFELLKGK